MRSILLFILLLAACAKGSAQKPSTQFFEIDTIMVDGNKKTRRPIILRELEFAQSDKVAHGKLKKLLKQSENNLLNTGLFNFVEINADTAGKLLKINIELTEQWYSWVFPYFEMVDRNFNTWWETKDFSRADYGLLFIQENFRGRNEEIHVKMIGGHNEYLNFRYLIPYFDSKKQWGAIVEGEFLRSRETAVLTRDDELVFFNDEERYPIKKNTGKVTLSYRKKLYRRHFFSLAYKDYAFMDTLAMINPDFLMGNKSRARYLGLSYEYERDFRDYISYPLKGHYVDIILEKEGLGMLDNVVDFWRFKGFFQKYWKFSSRWYAASGLTLSFSDESKQPYFLNSGLGYNKSFVRSYEYNVINGNNYGLLRSNIKFALIPTKTVNLDFIPLEQFSKLFYALYVNAFVDFGYVDSFDSWQSNGNHLPGELLMGKGIGIDLVTYYEKVFRFEYSWDKNNNGGFFLHFVAPI